MSSGRQKIILLPDIVVATIATLRNRIQERFGDCGLFRVCGQLLELAKIDMRRAVGIGRPYIWLRLLILATMAAAVTLLWRVAPLLDFSAPAADLYSLVQGIEAAANLTLLAGPRSSF